MKNSLKALTSIAKRVESYPVEFKERVKELSKKEYVEKLKINTPREILDLNLPSIQHISEIGGEAQVLILTYTKFEKYLEMAEFDLTEEQISIITERAIIRYAYFNFADIDLMLRKGISGELGKIYDKVRIDTILGKGGWLETYSNWQHRQKREIIDKTINDYFVAKGKDPITALNHYITEGIKKNINHLHTRYHLYRQITNLELQKSNNNESRKS